jgi:hypothetical protein
MNNDGPISYSELEKRFYPKIIEAFEEARRLNKRVELHTFPVENMESRNFPAGSTHKEWGWIVAGWMKRPFITLQTNSRKFLIDFPTIAMVSVASGDRRVLWQHPEYHPENEKV